MFRLIRGCATVIGMIVLGLIALGVYNAIARPRPPVPTAPSPAPAASSPASQPAQLSGSGSLETQLSAAEAQIRQAHAAGKHVPVSYALGDAQLTQAVNQAITSGQVQAPVSNVQVQAVPGQVLVHGQAHASILDVPFTMATVPTVSGGKAGLHVTGIDFGGLPVPQALSAQLASSVNSDNLLGDVPLTVTSFRAEQGRVMLEGTT